MKLHWGSISIMGHSELTVDVIGTTAGPLGMLIGIGKTEGEALEDLRQQGYDHLENRQRLILETLIVAEEHRLGLPTSYDHYESNERDTGDRK